MSVILIVIMILNELNELNQLVMKLKVTTVTRNIKFITMIIVEQSQELETPTP